MKLFILWVCLAGIQALIFGAGAPAVGSPWWKGATFGLFCGTAVFLWIWWEEEGNR